MVARQGSTYPHGASVANATDDIRGRVCVVTGATGGIGRATALGLARAGGTVVVLGRDPSRGAAVVREIAVASGNERVSLVVADLASLAAIEDAAREIASRHGAVHVLVNNAGVSLAKRRVSADGIEMTWAVNHVAPFRLTQLLLPLLERGAPSRVVNVSSEFARWGRLRFGDLQHEGFYNGTLAYLQSKLANVAFTLSLADRVRQAGIAALCVYPGLSVTRLLGDRWWWRSSLLAPMWRALFRTPEDGARAVVHVAKSAELATGTCCDSEGRPVRPPRSVRAPAVRQRLWEQTQAVIDSIS